MCSQTLGAEDTKFICKSVGDTDSVCEEDPPSLDMEVPSEENPIETIHRLGADTITTKTSAGTEEKSTEVESLLSEKYTTCNDTWQSKRTLSLHDGMTGFFAKILKGSRRKVIIFDFFATSFFQFMLVHPLT